jgi:outer membrane phospholipase A
MTIFIATISVSKNLDDASEINTKAYTPPIGWKLFKRVRPFRTLTIEDEDIVENMVIYKLVPENPELDKYWIHPDHKKNDPGMTNEAQEAINRVLCSLYLKAQDISSNLLYFWYIPKDASPDMHQPLMKYDTFQYTPIRNLATINRLRVMWMSLSTGVFLSNGQPKKAIKSI